MKKILFLLLILICFKITKADMGTCVRYYVDLKLKNNQRITGCFNFAGYIEAKTHFKNNKDFLKHIVGEQEGMAGQSIDLYTRLVQLPYPEPAEGYTPFEAAPNGTVVNVKIDEIKELKLIKMAGCDGTHHSDTAYYTSGGVNNIITGLSESDIQQLQKKPFDLYNTNPANDAGEVYIFLSYDENVKGDSLIKTGEKFVEILSDYFNYGAEKAGISSPEHLIDIYRKKKIIIVSYSNGC